MKRKSLDWSIEDYDGSQEKQRLREKFLDAVDSTTTSLSERASMRCEWQDALEKYNNIHQTKKFLQRILKK